MQTIKLNGIEFQATKNEIREALRIETEIKLGYMEVAQKTADIWMRSARDSKSAQRRSFITRALGLVPHIQYI